MTRSKLPVGIPGLEGCGFTFAIALPKRTRLYLRMSRARSFNLYWISVLLWMALIFSASTEAGSTQRTSRFLVPLLRWLKPDISPTALARVQFAIRKTGHLLEYAILAGLLWMAMRRSSGASPRDWSWTQARIVFIASVGYAATDELHQATVITRQASVADVGIDAFGALLALLLIAWICRRSRLPNVSRAPTHPR